MNHTEDNVVGSDKNERSRRFGFARVSRRIALALHVTHEAATDFLSVYNPLVRAIRERLPMIP